ncbi:MAG: dihydroorotate dehydrogenase electron transfer subunit [Mogibacterium sp.]|nr:dihydroorotate dehydrogenase electron transfer subunit [Mogibacterium sp.]
MEKGLFTIIENVALTPSTWRMRLAGDTSSITAAGQFINIRLDGHFLRRPISVNDVQYGTDGGQGVVTIIYKVLGKGTEEMTFMKPGKRLDVLTGLGNGYDLDQAGDMPLLIGGGVGIPPLYLAAKRLVAAGKKVTVILGFNSAEEVYYTDEFRNLGCEVIVTTADGSHGIRGFVTDGFRTLSHSFTQFLTCGPEPMLKAVYQTVYKEAGIPGQMSFEERMGCGFGACMGCSCKTVTGYKRICKDGPVLRTEEILW